MKQQHVLAVAAVAAGAGLLGLWVVLRASDSKRVRSAQLPTEGIPTTKNATTAGGPSPSTVAVTQTTGPAAPTVASRPRVTFEFYENERHSNFGGFDSTHLQRGDPDAHTLTTSVATKAVLSKFVLDDNLRALGFEWESPNDKGLPQFVPRPVASDSGDAEGWEYAKDFKGTFNKVRPQNRTCVDAC